MVVTRSGMRARSTKISLKGDVADAKSSKADVDVDVDVKKVHSTQDLHTARKLFHVGVGVYCLFEYNYRTLFVACCILAGWDLLFLMGELGRRKFPAVQRHSMKLFVYLMRKGEETRISGSSMFLVGLTITFVTLPKFVLNVALLCLTFGDPLASAVGVMAKRMRFRTPLPYSPHKSLEGCIAAMIVSTIVTRWAFHVSDTLLNQSLPVYLTSTHLWLASALIGVIAGVAESLTITLPVFGIADDNVSMILITGLLVWPLFVWMGLEMGPSPLSVLLSRF